MDNHEETHDSPRSCRDALSKKCCGIHKTGQNINEVIRKELDIPGIQDVRLKYKQNWMEEWTTPDCRNTPSTTNLEIEEIVDAPGNDGNASMPEWVKRPNPWRKMMTMMMMMMMMTLKRRKIKV